MRLGFLEGRTKMDLCRAYMETLESVVNALDGRDGNQSGHSRRVAGLVTSLTEIMGISGAEQ